MPRQTLSSGILLRPSLRRIGWLVGIHFDGVLVTRQDQGVWAIPIPQRLGVGSDPKTGRLGVAYAKITATKILENEDNP